MRSLSSELVHKSKAEFFPSAPRQIMMFDISPISGPVQLNLGLSSLVALVN